MRAHSVSVTRQTTGPTSAANGRVPQVQVEITPTLGCLIEPLKGKIRDEASLRFPEAKFLMSWPTKGQPILKVNDVITWKGRTLVVDGIEEDDSRPPDESEIEPYCLAYLKQVVK